MHSYATNTHITTQVLDASSQPANPAPAWLSPEGWEHVTTLDALPTFKGLAASFESAQAIWEAWFRAGVQPCIVSGVCVCMQTPALSWRRS